MKFQRNILDSRALRCAGLASLSLFANCSSAYAAKLEPIDCAESSADAIAKLAAERPDVLDANGFVIGSVLVEPANIFDLENSEEDGFLYRLANKAHITTHKNVIEQQLLFAEGDDFSNRLLEESERVLRKNRYLRDASVELNPKDNCVVDVNVKTVDTWTLSPKLTFSRSGGKNESKIGVREMNLLGNGILVEAFYSSDVDRQSKQLKVVDKNLGNSWHGLEFLYENSSDGHTLGVDLGKPFYALDATDAYGLSYYENDRIDSYYDLGEVVGEFRHQTQAYEISRGWSTGLVNNWVRRVTAGLAYDDHRFTASELDGSVSTTLPQDRQLFYPFVGVEWLQNKFDKARNFDQIGRTEDRFLGKRFSARLGRSTSQLGSDRDAWLVNLEAQTSLGYSRDKTLILNGSLATRVESSGLQNFALEGGLKYYRRQSDKRLFFASVSGVFGQELDTDHMLDLGGDTGLRGYPLRYQSGDRRALISVEQRIFTDWYPFRLFHVGAAAFVDVGRSWGDRDVTTTNLGWLKDAGIGLRLGNDRSGLGRVIHIDLAFPLDGNADIDSMQFLVSTHKSF